MFKPLVDVRMDMYVVTKCRWYYWVSLWGWTLDSATQDLVKHFTREKGQGWQDAGPGGRGPHPMERARGARMGGPPHGRLGQQHGGQFFADAGGGLTEDLRRLGLGGPERSLAHGPTGAAAGGWADEFMTAQAGTFG